MNKMEDLKDIKKICHKCNNEKSLLDFHCDKNTNDGFRIYCKECLKGNNKYYYNKNKDKYIALMKKRNENLKLNKMTIYYKTTNDLIEQFMKSFQDLYKEENDSINKLNNLLINFRNKNTSNEVF
jgi:hypothetical protein